MTTIRGDRRRRQDTLKSVWLPFVANRTQIGAAAGRREATMKSPVVIVLVAVVLVAIGTLAVMNNVCKSSQHAWCAPMSTVRHHIKTGQS